MPEQRLQRTREDYGGFISQAILSKTMQYAGDGRVWAIVNGEWRCRLTANDRDTRWLLPSELPDPKKDDTP